MTLRELINQVTDNDSESLVLDYNIHVGNKYNWKVNIVDTKVKVLENTKDIAINLTDSDLNFLLNFEV